MYRLIIEINEIFEHQDIQYMSNFYNNAHNSIYL